MRSLALARIRNYGKAAFIAAAMFAALAAQAQSEYDVKAAFLFNFTKYIDWPGGALPSGAPLVIGVLGRDPFGRTLDDLVQGKSVNGHPLSVRRFKSADDVSGCHLLFISHGDFTADRMSRLRNRPIVIVSETPGAVQRGSIINFVIEGGKVRFEIGASAAKEAGLSISSKLLALARQTK